MGKILGEIKILGIKEIPDLELQNNYKMETTPETKPETIEYIIQIVRNKK